VPLGLARGLTKEDAELASWDFGSDEAKRYKKRTVISLIIEMCDIIRFDDERNEYQVIEGPFGPYKAAHR